MLPKDYYKKVEEVGFLKHILYGDSVSEKSLSRIRFKNKQHFKKLSFHSLWNKLVQQGCSVQKIADKEYIFIKDEIETIGYNTENDELIKTVPEYLMRHYFNGQLMELSLENGTILNVTQNHSMLDYSPSFKTLTESTPQEVKYVPFVYYDRRFIGPIKIKNRKLKDFSGYVYDFKIPKFHNFVADNVLVHNTDSIFISIPTDISKLTLEQKWELAEKSADDINDIIIKYLTQELLPRCNINPEQNQTYFKTELVFDSAMFMDVKKQYAYKLLIKEGNVLKKPKIKYTGIQVVKSDAAKLTQDLLREMIEDVALNSDILKNEKIEYLSKVVTKFKQKFDDDILKVEYQDIGLPGKWGGRVLFVNGMKLYNFIMNREVFSISSAGKFLYCKFHNPPILKGIDLKETKGICVPYMYDTNEVKAKMEQFGIEIDADVQWSKLFTLTCERVVNLIKQSCR